VRLIACCSALAAPLAAVLLAGAAAAQVPLPDPDPLSARDARRLDRMEQVMRELRSIVFQARQTGRPVLVQPAETEGRIGELSDRISSLEQTLTRLNGALETQGHELSIARRDLAAAQAANTALAARLQTVEQQLAAAQPPQVVQPADGGPPGPGAAADPEGAFASARQLLLAGDYARAETAFSDYLATYADGPRTPEARYYLGKAQLARRAYPDAASSFIAAIRGWPQTPWAPDAVLSLARSLVGMQRNPDACSTLGELRRRYPNASMDVVNRAATLRTQAACRAASS
jgi:tol-pal system protein YbgF